MYRKTDVVSILSNMTKKELGLLRDLYFGNKKLSEVYRGSNYQNALDRFHQIRDSLRPYLTTIPGTPTTIWTFPKGRLEHRETSWQCALREFSEEAGFDVASVGTLMGTTLYNENYVSFDHEMYETNCWLYTVEHEVPLTLPVGDEIAERRWVPAQDIAQYLSPTKLEMIKKSLEKLIK
jgi:8-oxo-dGTP pyrophosphatase MutT (NUDIX family)